MKVLVTGATGYIGNHLLKALQKDNIRAVATARSKSQIKGRDWIHYDLAEPFDSKSFPDDVTHVIHLAISSDWQDKNRPRNDLKSLNELLDWSDETGAKFIFVSSQTAQAETPSPYGRVKWEMEQLVNSHLGYIIRPGQVYGGRPGGLFQNLLETTAKIPVIPAFVPSPYIQPVHIDDLVKAIITILTYDGPRRLFLLGEEHPVKFSEFLESMATGYLRKDKHIVVVPKFFLSLARRISPSKSLRKSLSKFLSLYALPVMITDESWESLNIRCRSIWSGMNKSGSLKRRKLLQEGNALITYLLGLKPSPSLLIRYVRAIESLRNGKPLGFTKRILKRPNRIKFLQFASLYKTTWGKEFKWRLNAATYLAEATVQGARTFLMDLKGNSFFSSMGLLTLLAFEEAWIKIRQLFSFRIARKLNKLKERNDATRF